jgi:hypothetical protein
MHGVGVEIAGQFLVTAGDKAFAVARELAGLAGRGRLA